MELLNGIRFAVLWVIFSVILAFATSNEIIVSSSTCAACPTYDYDCDDDPEAETTGITSDQPTGPPGPIQNLIIQHKGYDLVFITWEPPETCETVDVEYIVELNVVKNTTMGFDILDKTTEPYYVCKEAVPGCDYQVRVATKTEKGVSTPVESEVFRVEIRETCAPHEEKTDSSSNLLFKDKIDHSNDASKQERLIELQKEYFEKLRVGIITLADHNPTTQPGKDQSKEISIEENSEKVYQPDGEISSKNKYNSGKFPDSEENWSLAMKLPVEDKEEFEYFLRQFNQSNDSDVNSYRNKHKSEQFRKVVDGSKKISIPTSRKKNRGKLFKTGTNKKLSDENDAGQSLISNEDTEQEIRSFGNSVLEDNYHRRPKSFRRHKRFIRGYSSVTEMFDDVSDDDLNSCSSVDNFHLKHIKEPICNTSEIITWKTDLKICIFGFMEKLTIFSVKRLLKCTSDCILSTRPDACQLGHVSVLHNMLNSVIQTLKHHLKNRHYVSPDLVSFVSPSGSNVSLETGHSSQSYTVKFKTTFMHKASLSEPFEQTLDRKEIPRNTTVNTPRKCILAMDMNIMRRCSLKMFLYIKHQKQNKQTNFKNELSKVKRCVNNVVKSCPSWIHRKILHIYSLLLNFPIPLNYDVEMYKASEYYATSSIP